MIALLIALVGGYLLGSLPGALVLGAIRKVDIRRMGSGNAGGTNALRTVGWPFALAVVAIDIGKGVLAASLLPILALWLSRGTGPDPVSLASAAGLMTVIGHIWPVFFGFRGGKGASTLLGVVAVVAPWCLIPMLLVWLVTLLGAGYVGLATILGALSLVPAMWTLGPRPLPLALGVLAIVLPMLIVFTHRSNLMRMRAGDENRFDKARLLRPRNGSS